MLLRVERAEAMDAQTAKNALNVHDAHKMRWSVWGAVALALLGFSANSLLCRLALAPPARIDALGFTLLRLLSGALMLLSLSGLRRARTGVSLPGTLALLVYMLAFSASYVRIGAALGALLLFASVQATMLGVALLRGERIGARTWLGLLCALLGVAWLVAPGVGAPEPCGSLLMVTAGAAWGLYSLLGRRTGDALGTTAGNFVAATALLLAGCAAWLLMVRLGPSGHIRSTFASLGPLVAMDHVTRRGVALAIASGALASGLGYALWYRALPQLGAPRAAVVQLLVPVLAAGLAVPLLAEVLRLRLIVAGGLVLSGVALALWRPARSP